MMENDPLYIARLMALPDIEKRRLLYGDWSIFEGQVFQDLIEKYHSAGEFKLPPEWYYFGSFDWGYAKPFSYAVYAVDYDDVLYRVMEWYGCKETEEDCGLKMTAADVADGILEREAALGVKIKDRVADPSIWNTLPKFRRKEVEGKDIREDMESRGVFFTPADNDRLQGWQQIHRRLQIDREYDEDGAIINESPRFVALNTQTNFWRLVPEMMADKSRPEDIDTTQEDHIADEFRYACMHRPVKPRHKVIIKPGSFKHARDKHIAAMNIAKRRGISITQAYQRVR